MIEKNILITSVGRRVELIQLFQKAAKRLNVRSKIVAGDCSKTAPALYFADEKYILPRIEEENYVNEIIKISNKENVSLIVPTIDTELLLLAKEKKNIESKTNAKVLISDYRTVSICRDKVKTQLFLEENNFGVPKLYNMIEVEEKALKYPVFIKPKSGSSSINAFKVENDEQLNRYLSYIEDPMIQEYIVGEEYTVDVFLDFDSNIITIAPRIRLATRSGESLKGKIVKNREIINDVKKLMKVMKPIGHITVQLMKTGTGIRYIEINPRFGGGAPMTIMSGADSCENLFRLLIGENLQYNEEYTNNNLFLRFDNSICLNENMEKKDD